MVAYLQKNYPHDAVIDLPVSLGQERVSCRLLAYRLPEKVVEERRRKVLEEARKKAGHSHRTLSIGSPLACISPMSLKRCGQQKS